MASEDAETFRAAILAAVAAGVTSVTVDGNTTTAIPLSDLIAAAEYLDTTAVVAGRKRRPGYRKIAPPGAD